MIRKSLMILILFLLFGFITIDNFHYEREIITTENYKDNISKIYIDEHIYENTNNNFSDIRIFNKNNKEISYYIRNTKQLKIRKKVHVESFKILSFKKSNNNSVEIVCENPNPAQYAPYKINFVIYDCNFEKKVDVAVSNDNINWITINQNQDIYDYSKYIDIRKKEIDIFKKNAKYYKVIIKDFTKSEQSPIKKIIRKLNANNQVEGIEECFISNSKTIKISKLNFYISEQKNDYVGNVDKQYNLDILDTTNDKELKETYIILKSKKILLNSIIINTEDYNFKRSIVLLGSNDNNKWITLATNTIYKILTNNINKYRLKVQFNKPGRYEFLKLVIKNGDNLPIKVKKIVGSGNLQEIVFFSKPEFGDMKLCYGGDDIPVPVYDAHSVLEEIPYTKGTALTLGDYKKLPGIKPIKETESIFSTKTFLVIIVSLMVIILLIIISFSIKKIENIK